MLILRPLIKGLLTQIAIKAITHISSEEGRPTRQLIRSALRRRSFHELPQLKAEAGKLIASQMPMLKNELQKHLIAQLWRKRKFRSPLSSLILAAFMTSLTLSSCDTEGTRHAPDVSDIKVGVKIRRFDQELFALDTNQLEVEATKLQAAYPTFFPLYTSGIIKDVTNTNETPMQALESFLRAPQLRNLYDTVQTHYSSMAQTEKELHQMFKYYKYYFPQKPTPEIITIISEYGTDAFTFGDSTVGVGLDMFLGPDFSGYDPQIFPDFLKRSFDTPYIPVRLAKAIAQDNAGAGMGERLLDQMLHAGKILYTTKALLPNTPDSLIMGYTTAQMDGCIYNEKAVWKRMLDQNLLYTTERDKIRKLVSPSPNAPVIFDEAPGEIGSWMGWRIVDAYMARNPKTTLQELYALTDSQAFLEKAAYKPKR